MPHPHAAIPGQPASAAALWPPLARFIAAEERLAERAQARGPWAVGVYELVRFGVKQGWACLFGGLMLAAMIATHLWYPAGTPVPRYEALLVVAVAIQVGLLAFGLETREEAKVILLFHAAGTAMEMFETAVGSWVYPEPSVVRIGGVRLFTGFMNAAVGSPVARAWLYPGQRAGWTLVSLGSWFLLMIISDAMVALLNRPTAIERWTGSAAPSPVPA